MTPIYPAIWPSENAGTRSCTAEFQEVEVFAVIRVISAIFLCDTLDAAHNDAEHLVTEAWHNGILQGSLASFSL